MGPYLPTFLLFFLYFLIYIENKNIPIYYWTYLSDFAYFVEPI